MNAWVGIYERLGVALMNAWVGIYERLGWHL